MSANTRYCPHGHKVTANEYRDRLANRIYVMFDTYFCYDRYCSKDYVFCKVCEQYLSSSYITYNSMRTHIANVHNGIDVCHERILFPEYFVYLTSDNKNFDDCETIRDVITVMEKSNYGCILCKDGECRYECFPSDEVVLHHMKNHMKSHITR